MRVAIVAGVILMIFLGLFFWSGGKLIALEYTDFPQSELEKLMIAGVAEAELTLSGPLKVEASSRWTRWAMMLLPGTFLVDVKINGREASLVVDTGAPQTVLSPRQALTAQVLLTSRGPTAQHWEEVPTYLGRAREFELAGLVVHELPVIVAGKQPVLKLLRLPVWYLDGLLGMKLLQHLALTLDYERGVVLLRRESAALQTPSAPLQILREPGPGGLEHPKPTVDCSISGSGPFTCFIDTGTSAHVFVPREIWQALGLEGQKKARLQIRLGEVELKDAPAIPANTRHIVIGSNIFQAQGFKRLTLDFLAGKLYAER